MGLREKSLAKIAKHAKQNQSFNFKFFTLAILAILARVISGCA